MSGPESKTQGPGRPTNLVETPGPSHSQLRLLGASIVVGLATLLLMVATEPWLAIVWDEGYTLGREARIRTWLHALTDPSAFAQTWRPETMGKGGWTPPDAGLVQNEGAPPPRSDQVDSRSKLLFDPDVLAYFWPFAREEPHGHPPFYAILGLAGDVLTPGRAMLSRARLGPILLFSLAAGALFHFVVGRWGWWAGAASAGAWALQPHLFGHGHYAAYDGPLTSLWLLAIFTFIAAVERSRWWSVAFGLILGCAMADKLTGWFLPLPFLVWAILYRSRPAFLVLTIGATVGLATTYALQPAWWVEPIAGPLRFFQSNLTRGQTIPIPVRFLGLTYQTPLESLPWYNTIAWTVMATPLGFLLLALAGAGRALRRWRIEPVLLLLLGHWLFLLALRAMPHTPGHDGVRLFLPAFGILAVLAGPGAAMIVSRLGKAGGGLVSLALIEGAVGIVWMMPVPLSYYSPIIGGLPGAAKLGMEPTYYWDALDADARSWLRSQTGEGRTIQFATFPTSWLYLRSIGELPPKIAPIDPGSPQWYILQNRPGAMQPWDHALVAGEASAYTVSRLGVPLVWIFPFERLEAAVATGRRRP